MDRNMRAAGWFVLLIAVISGCTTSNPTSCVDGYCQDPRFPFCDSDGSLSGSPLTCVAVSCTPGEAVGCRGDQAIVCNATGDDYDLGHCDHGCVEGKCTQLACTPGTASCGNGTVETCSVSGALETEACELDCVPTPQPHCRYISPKYLPDICDARAAAADRTVTGNEIVDTSVDSFCNGGIVAQPGGPELCVVRYGSFTLTGSWRVTGTRALALVTDGKLTIAGILDISSSGSLTGPGASVMGTSGLGTGRGGGAGLATKGGDEGGAPGTGGSPYDPLALPYLSAGMTGGRKAVPCSAGGAGGGGATLISCRHSVLVEGSVYAGGHGGPGGGTNIGGNGARCVGGGGGAGGIVLFQGLDVRISGRVFANGGGGGCGANGVITSPAGADATNARATGPSCQVANGANGGTGGTAVNAPGNGLLVTGTAAIGAGGGSVGVLQALTPLDVVPAISPISVSPDFTERKPVPTR